MLPPHNFFYSNVFLSASLPPSLLAAAFCDKCLVTGDMQSDFFCWTFLSVSVYFGICVTIRARRDIQCHLYSGFFMYR